MLGTTGIGCNVRQVDIGLLAGGQLDLGLFSSFLQTLHGKRVAAQINTLVLFEFIRQVIDQTLVEVFTTQEGITVGGQHFELMLTVDFGNFNNGNIEGAATQIVHGDLYITALLVHTVGQRRGGGLVDDSLDVQAGNFTGVLGRLALGVVEIGRHGDNRFGNFFTEIVFRRLFHLL